MVVPIPSCPGSRLFRWLPMCLLPMCLALFPALAADLAMPGTCLPALRGEDQRRQPVDLVAPYGIPVVVVVADRDAEKVIGDWPAKAAALLGDRVKILGVADLRGVPRFLAGLVRRRLARHDNPVLLDWSGRVAGWCGAPAGQVTLIALEPDGRPRGALTSPWTPEEFDRFCEGLKAD